MHRIQERQRLWRIISILAIAALSFSLLVVCEKAAEEAAIIEIVERLATVQTQEEAEAAIRDLIDEIGLGVPGTPYEEYELSDEQISRFAQFLVAFVAGEFTLNMGQVFAQVEAGVSEQGASLTEEIQGALIILQAQASEALTDLEDPDNALVIAIIAEGGEIPDTVPELSAEKVVSPMQGLLFGAWVIEHLAQAPAAKPAQWHNDTWLAFLGGFLDFLQSLFH